MRIALTGAHGTGKTAVAKAVSSRTGLNLVTSASREALEYGFTLNEEATGEDQAAISVGRLARQVSAGENYISDRTVLDSMAYNYYQLQHKWADDRKSQYWYKVMAELTPWVMNIADAIIYVPISFPLVADGVRPMAREYQRHIDDYVIMFLEEYDLDYHVMPNGTIEYRTNWVINTFDLN